MPLLSKPLAMLLLTSLVVVTFLGGVSSSAQEESGFRHLPRQMNNSSCQSYALGLAVHHEEEDGPFSFDVSTDENFFKDLRQAEAKIRTLVEFSKGAGGGVSSRTLETGNQGVFWYQWAAKISGQRKHLNCVENNQSVSR